IYIAVILRITVFRSNFSLNSLFQNGNVNLTIFKGYMIFVRSRNWYRFIYLFVGNIVWFIPFGMYLQYTEKLKNILAVTLCGMLFSLCIETLQFVFGTGVTELDDLILNTFGAFIGAVSVKLFQKFRNR
ncbi:MAG: VanZ family protein, partial [Lachnospiraceae bacterium]|nr:VanZ family protein [Lachnospiraceae bacterium]